MNEPMRILHVCQRMEAAGVQSFIMNIYRNIDREKVQFDFLVHYKEKQFYDDEIQSLGGRIYKLSVREDYNIAKYWKDLNDFFRNHKYEVVHGHMDTLGAIYLLAAKNNGVKVRIAHSHNEFVQEGIKKIPRLMMIKLYSLNATHLFACSNNSGRFMFGDKKFIVINNSIDVDKFRFNQEIRTLKRKELGIEECFVVGNVGRFHISKNQIFLLEIFSEILKIENKSKLILIGSGNGEDEKIIVDRINSLNISGNVLMLKDRRDVNELYQAMDAYVMPSLYEGFPVTAVEAQASGLPCFFSNSITKDVKLIDSTFFVSLDDSPKHWAERIVESRKNSSRDNEFRLVKKAGYDIKTNADMLTNFYLKFRGKNE